MKRRAVRFASAAFFVTSLALASDTWILDSKRSNVRVFRGTRTNPESMNTGVARVAGKVKLDTNDLDASVFNLSIFPADEDWRPALSPEDTLPTGYVPDATDQPLLTFRSTRILSTKDGQLEVIGNFSLNRVERAVITTQTGAYAGRVGGVPVIRNETREIMFLFPSVSAAHLSGPLAPSMLHKKGVLEIVGSARVDREEFPELLTAMRETKWPPVVEKKDCHIPFTGGGDYSGARCAETLIAGTGDDKCCTPASVGEDYSSSECTPAASNQTTIILDLKFLHTVREPSIGMLSENG